MWLKAGIYSRHSMLMILKFYDVHTSNVSVTESSFIHLKRSRNLTISGFSFENTSKLIFFFDRSNFTEISNIRVENSGKAIVAENTRIDLMNNCTFIGNENSSNKSGVLDLYNTDIVIKNSTFSKNKAEIGASVFFN
jgi:polygalacturonase